MLDSIASMLAGPLAGTISKATGLPEGVVKMGVAAAIPALLGVLAKNAKDKNGAQALHGALERDHDGSVLQDLDGYVQQGGNLDDGDKILGHALGDRRSVAEQAIAEKAGMDLGQVSKLLPMLAPLLMGALGKEQRSRGLDADGLANLVQEQQVEAVKRDEGGLGGMAALLDRDGDGNMMDDLGDLAGLASKFLNK